MEGTLSKSSEVIVKLLFTTYTHKQGKQLYYIHYRIHGSQRERMDKSGLFWINTQRQKFHDFNG